MSYFSHYVCVYVVCVKNGDLYKHFGYSDYIIIDLGLYNKFRINRLTMCVTKLPSLKFLWTYSLTNNEFLLSAILANILIVFASLIGF